MKKESYDMQQYPEPSYQDLMYSQPSMENIESALAQHQMAHPEQAQPKNSPLLAAGLGAGMGMAIPGVQAYDAGKVKHRARIEKAIESFAKKNIDPHEYKGTSKLYKLFQPTDAHMTAKHLASQRDKAKAFITSNLQPQFQHKRGLEAVKRMPKGKLALGAGAGGLLGYLANKVLSEQGGE